MLTNDREHRNCKKYGARGPDGKVRCSECPLVKDKAYRLCKANSHYDRSLKEWVMDDDQYTEVVQRV